MDGGFKPVYDIDISDASHTLGIDSKGLRRIVSNEAAVRKMK